MNVVVIFAGGTGQRMNSGTKPKQFLEVHGKPIIIYTLEKFENCLQIDGIIVVCLSDWVERCKEMIERFSIKKVVNVVSGGKTGFESRMIGVKTASEVYPDDTVILMHDGVRPLIDDDNIIEAIETVKKYGSAITVSPAIETIAIKEEDECVNNILDRSKCQLAKAPQCFYLGDLKDVHIKAIEDGLEDCIDTAFLMKQYGYSLHTVVGKPENIKITTPSDFYIFRALLDAKENTQVVLDLS